VEELIGSVEQGAMLSAVSARLSTMTGAPVTIPIHINIDTGMGRMGVQSVEEIRDILSLPGLQLKGIMTHFAQSDNETETGETRTREQVRRFDELVKKAAVDPRVIRHTANSAATSRFPWSRMDMVRVGSLIYGDVTKATDPEGIFLPVMKSFTSSVALVMHDVPPSTTVGYDSLYTTPAGRRSTLATVKVGYCNGYPRDAYTNGTEILIGGRRYPVVGKVSMNLLVADITSQDTAHPVRIGDEVVLLGRQGKETITMEELSSRNRLTTYELLLRLGNNNGTRVIRRAGR